MSKQKGPYTVERYEREQTDDYGKAGEVEWRLVDSRTGECLDIYPRRWQAKECADAMNARESK